MSQNRYDLRIIVPAYHESCESLDNILKKLSGLAGILSMKNVLITFVIRDASDTIREWAKEVK
ncbi:MAG: hypothetical protein ACTSRU_05350, partial [Candidatus Hodarchaeales archaeon]